MNSHPVGYHKIEAREGVYRCRDCTAFFTAAAVEQNLLREYGDGSVEIEKDVWQRDTRIPAPWEVVLQRLQRERLSQLRRNR
jgi:hypothetical protein